MKKVMCFLLIAVIYVCFIGKPAYAPKDSVLDLPDPKYDVHVKVSCDDNTTKSMIESYIKRELRSLGDVELVDQEDATWILSLIAISHTANGNKTGYTSLTVMSLFKHTAESAIMVAFHDYQNTFEKGLSAESYLLRSPKMREIAEKHGSFPTYNYPNLQLIVNIKDNDLPNTCKEIIAEFDVKALEPNREQNREIRRILNRR